MVQFRSIGLSAHLDSFCMALSDILYGEFEFVYLAGLGKMRKKIGWREDAKYRNCHDDAAARNRALECDTLIVMEREFDLIEKRLSMGKKTVYMSERWLKPIRVRLFWRVSVVLPGIVRVLVPSYRRMVGRFIRFMDNSSFYVLPIGVHAVRDMIRLHKLMHGHISCLFKEPLVEIERRVGGDIKGFPNMKLWCYFVEGSTCKGNRVEKANDVVDILWCGRMVDWKRVDVLVKAVKILHGKNLHAKRIQLLLVGEGPERGRLEAMATDCEYIRFEDFKRQEEVRELMRRASFYVMPSNAEEGWGAAISDALSEGCAVISTYEAGSSATLLPNSCLYHSSNIKELVEKLREFSDCPIYEYDGSKWSGDSAARQFIELIS